MSMLFFRASRLWHRNWRLPLTQCVLLVALLAVVSSGCSRSILRAEDRPTSRRVGEIGHGSFDERVQAFVVPPDDWELDPPKVTDRHTHLVWLSPTGDTAYGAIYIELPTWAPVFMLSARSLHNTVLDRIVDAMADDQGEATLLSKEWDREAERMHYEMEGGLYQIDAILSVRGYSGWTVYAGKLSEKPVNEEEMATALEARDATRVGEEAATLEEE